MHLWTTAGAGLYPVCGTPTKKGPIATQVASYRDLCPLCRQHQATKSSLITAHIRKNRRKGQET